MLESSLECVTFPYNMSNTLQCEMKYLRRTQTATFNKVNISVGQKQHFRLTGLLGLGIGRGGL